MVFHWFRRDLRLDDNKALFAALEEGNVQCIFIFDDQILNELPSNDPRVNFIYDELEKIHIELLELGSSLLVKKGNPEDCWNQLIQDFNPTSIYTNRDYEPYAIKRDTTIEELAKKNNCKFHSFKDQVIFETSEVVKGDGLPYTIYTPYMKRWRLNLVDDPIQVCYSENELNNLVSSSHKFPTKNGLGIKTNSIKVLPFTIHEKRIENYAETRNFPAQQGTSLVGPHLRFGTISVRKLALHALNFEETYLKELIWRDFFMQILFHFPHVVTKCFKPKYERVPWTNNKEQFKKWCNGETGYPMVDAGMRELNETGYMHNRVRMITAGFLCKHLLIDWRWGEAYFAKKLFDYDLSANNGNWQWAAGTGCDSAPYFRVFNPTTQIQKFDKALSYINKWVPELNDFSYPKPIVDHASARTKAIETYKKAISE